MNLKKVGYVLEGGGCEDDQEEGLIQVKLSKTLGFGYYFMMDWL